LLAAVDFYVKFSAVCVMCLLIAVQDFFI